MRRGRKSSVSELKRELKVGRVQRWFFSWILFMHLISECLSGMCVCVCVCLGAILLKKEGRSQLQSLCKREHGTELSF